MANTENNSKLHTTGKVAWRVLLPFAAMRQTVTLAKKELGRTQKSLSTLKNLGDDARKAITDGIKGNSQERDDSFETAMNNRSKDALSQDQLYDFFLRKKRAALLAAALFALLGLYGVLSGIWQGHGRDITLSVISLVASQPIFFLVALSAQLRLWQLRTRRLSKEEKGGLQDFMGEVKGWWWMTLNPEFAHEKKD